MTLERMLSASEVAAMFGVTARTLWNWESAGVLVPTRIQRQRYYPETAVMALLGKRENLTLFQSVAELE
jgi:DNA-binding transcriptional MerR regulator